MPKKRPRPHSARSERRTALRAADKLASQREKLARLELGGTADRPIEVTSISVIEPRAASHACLRCGGRTRLEDHRAEAEAGRRLRLITLRCPTCSASRTLYFRLVRQLPS